MRFTQNNMNRMLIRISCYSQTLSWYLVLADGGISQGDGDTLTPPPAGTHITVLLPSGQLIFREVAGKGSSLATLKWGFEGFTLSDPDALHVTLLRREGHRHHLVALPVAQMESWLDGLSQVGIRPDCVLPDSLAIEAGSMLQVNDEWIIRDRTWQGSCALPAQREALLRIRGNEHLTMADGGMATLLAGCRAQRSNLLHGQFAPQRPGRSRAGLITGFSLLMFFSGLILPPVFQGVGADWRASDAREEAGEIYHRLFGPRTGSDLQRDLHDALETEARGVRERSLLTRLHAQAAWLSELNREVTALKWNAATGALTLTLSPPLAREDLPASEAGTLSLSEDGTRLTSGGKTNGAR